MTDDTAVSPPTTPAGTGAVRPEIRTIDLDHPWEWLKAGWADFKAAPTVGLIYGLLVAVLGLVLLWFIWAADILYLILPLTAGFMLVGPLMAVGLYEVSRRLGKGETPTLSMALMAFRRNGDQIVWFGLILMLIHLVWIRIAQIIFALFHVHRPPTLDRFVVDVFLQVESIPFLIAGCVAGGVLAVVVFSISAVSIPMLLDRQVSLFTAIGTSVAVVRQNFWTMALWGWLVVVFVVAGLAVAYVGLAVTLPLIGHATWHAYKGLVSWPDETTGEAKADA